MMPPQEDKESPLTIKGDSNKTKIAKRRHTRIEKIQTIGREPLSGKG